MAKKTAVRRIGKMLPQSPDYQRAIAIEDGQIRSIQPFVDEGVLDADYSTEKHDPEKINKMRDEAGKAAPNESPVAPGEKQAVNKERTEALELFDRMVSEYQMFGGVPDKLLGLHKVDAAKVHTFELSRIRAATTIIKQAIEQGNIQS